MIAQLRITALLLVMLAGSSAAIAQLAVDKYNGFVVEGGLIDPLDICHGGPQRDGIPSIDRPQFLVGVARDGEIDSRERIMGVKYNGVAKAYPISILDQHEIVNDEFNDTAIMVTYCPLCGSGMVFLAQVGVSSLQFGVSGLLYNNDVLLYDRETQSLWSQIMKTAVTGPLKGARLIQIPARYTTWGSWLDENPDTLLLSRETGFSRDYDADVYYDYKRLPKVIYPNTHQDTRIPAKDWVVGIALGEEALALPFKQLDQLEDVLVLTLGDTALEIHWDRESSSVRAYTRDGEEIPTTSAYWFAWVAFHPRTALF